MWPKTPLTTLLGIEYPIIQAPMAGGPSTPELVAAVSEAGGLGSLGMAYLQPEAIREAIHAVRRLTSRPFNVNLFTLDPPAPVGEAELARARALLAPYRAELGLQPDAAPPPASLPSLEAQLAVILEERVPVFSFTFGIPTPDVLRRVRESGAVILGTATTVVEGQRLAEAGVDAVVAQGSEAGAHRGTFAGSFEGALVGTLALVPQLVDAVTVPVVAAGGIMDGRGVAAALALGAVGVQMGTAFLACPESGASPAHKAAVLAATEDATIITRAFSGRPARGLVNRFAEEMAAHAGEIAPFPVQNALTRDIRQAAARQNRPELLSLWSGQTPRLATDRPAAEIVRAVVEQTAQVIAGLGR
jgi:nitronate monooxygenase